MNIFHAETITIPTTGERFTLYPMAVCVDCLMMHANGEIGGDAGEEENAAHAAAMSAQLEGAQMTLGTVTGACEYCDAARETDPDGDWECEAWFSWSSCDGCGSGLGGDRSHATLWVPEA